jgi:hypothetical protein
MAPALVTNGTLITHNLQDCKGSNHCLSVCAKSCAKPQTIVNGEQCKRYGRDSSQKAAKLACENTLVSESLVAHATSHCYMHKQHAPILPKRLSNNRHPLTH